jgi:hypothetical protein
MGVADAGRMGIGAIFFRLMLADVSSRGISYRHGVVLDC